jgi:hypothetical protein
LADFVRSVRIGTDPRSNGRLWLEIVRAVEVAGESMGRGGEPVELNASGLGALAFFGPG